MSVVVANDLGGTVRLLNDVLVCEVHGSVYPLSRVLKRSSNVALFEVPVVTEDSLVCRASGEEVENVTDPNAEPTQTGTSPTLLWINGDAV